MDTRWSLDNIYPSPNSPELRADMEVLEKGIADLNLWCRREPVAGNDPAGVVKEYIDRKNALLYFNKVELYLSLTNAVDTEDELVGSLLDRVAMIKGEEAVHEALFALYMRDKDVQALMEAEPSLREYEYFLKCAKREGEHSLSPGEELVAAKLSVNGSTLWQRQWEQLTSGLEGTYVYKGKEHTETLTRLRAKASSEDSGLREAAYKGELQSYRAVEVPAAFCMNGVKGQVLTLASLRGYDSPLEMTVEQSAMTMDALNAMLSAIREFIPVCAQYFRAKARLLGHRDGRLPFYDIFAPVGVSPQFTPQEARDRVLAAFYDFAEEMGDFAAHAFENRWIDMMPGKGKVGGAFCEAIHPIGESRILTNFTGTFEDVITLAHELGHGYHDSRLYSAAPLNSSYPLPIAETASTLCETVLINHSLKGCGEGEAFVILENDLSGIMQTISDIYSRFLFEDRVFKERQEGILSPERLCKIMEEAQREAYGDSLRELHPYMWLCKPHYYDGEFNYYNFPYAFGMLLSKALYGKYREMGGDFMPMYNRLLENSSTRDLKTCGAEAGFNIEDKGFWLYGLSIVKEEINKFTDIVSDMI